MSDTEHDIECECDECADLAARFICIDCDEDTSRVDYYMVHDRVWKAAGMGDDGMLCTHCLEERLGRPMMVRDYRKTNKENREFWGGCTRMYPTFMQKAARQAEKLFDEQTLTDILG